MYIGMNMTLVNPYAKRETPLQNYVRTEKVEHLLVAPKKNKRQRKIS